MIYLNNREINITRFPDGTKQVWKLTAVPEGDVKIDWYYGDDGEFFQVMQLVDLLHSLDQTRKIDIFIPYLPYARQDKDISNDATFGLHTFIDALSNNNAIHSIVILDPHNAEPLISIPEDRLLKLNLDYLKEWCFARKLIAPDKGAAKRLQGYDIVLDKERDQSTGKILGVTGVPSDLNDRYVVVDDLCDGGATFIAIAKAVNVPKNRIDLFVTHGIFSAGLDKLMDHFGTVTCTCSTMGFASSVLLDGLRRYPDRFNVLFDFEALYS